MSKITVAFDVAKLFDAMAQMQGDHSALMGRVLGVLLTGRPSFADAVGLAAYGIEVRPSAAS